MMVPTLGLTHIALAVRDGDRSARVYMTHTPST
jgi:hypothetical protein